MAYLHSELGASLWKLIMQSLYTQPSGKDVIIISIITTVTFISE